MVNLTKLFCDLISVGTQLPTTSVSNEQIGRNVRYLGVSHLPEGFDVDFEAIDDHIRDCRAAIHGSDYDIDKLRRELAQGKPVSIKRITEFHNQLTVHLSDDTHLSFNSSDIVRY